MRTDSRLSDPPLSVLVAIDGDGNGSFTARAIGLPEAAATAPTREEALRQVHERLTAALASGRLVPLDLATASQSESCSQVDPDDLLEREFRDDLERFRQEDLERTLREDEQDDRA